jgi:hypothetical protein
MADINLQEVHDFMIEIARKVGERITSATPSTGAAGSKKNCTSINAKAPSLGTPVSSWHAGTEIPMHLCPQSFETMTKQTPSMNRHYAFSSQST